MVIRKTPAPEGRRCFTYTYALTSSRSASTRSLLRTIHSLSLGYRFFASEMIVSNVSMWSASESCCRAMSRSASLEMSVACACACISSVLSISASIATSASGSAPSGFFDSPLSSPAIGSETISRESGSAFFLERVRMRARAPKVQLLHRRLR